MLLCRALTSWLCLSEPPRCSGAATMLVSGDHTAGCDAAAALQSRRSTALAPGHRPRPPRTASTADVPCGTGQLGQIERARVVAGGGHQGRRAAVRMAMPEPPGNWSGDAKAFAWGGAEGDEALRLPSGVAAAERLAASRPPGRPARPLQPPAEVEEARKDPVAVLAVLLIISWQLIGSLIGLTRDVLPEEYQRAAVMDEAPPLERSGPSRPPD